MESKKTQIQIQESRTGCLVKNLKKGLTKEF